MLPAKQEGNVLATDPHQNSKNHFTTHNTVTLQKAVKTPTLSSTSTPKCTQAREQGTHMMWVGKTPLIPKFFIKHKKGSCSWHPLLSFLLSLSTWGVLLFLLGDVPFGLIHIVLAPSFQVVSLKWAPPSLLVHLLSLGTPGLAEAHCQSHSSEVFGSKKQLINQSDSTLRIKSWSPSLVGVTENNGRSLLFLWRTDLQKLKSSKTSEGSPVLKFHPDIIWLTIKFMKHWEKITHPPILLGISPSCTKIQNILHTALCTTNAPQHTSVLGIPPGLELVSCELPQLSLIFPHHYTQFSDHTW